MKNKEKILKRTSKNMRQQSNRLTMYPLFVILVDKKIWVEPYCDYDTRERKEEVDPCDLCEKCKDLEEECKELPEDCTECEEESYDHFKQEQDFDLNAGVFFTEQACQDHIDANDYHYSNPRSYAISAWRNPEMVAVMNQILELTKGGIPPHYQHS